jgi:hypothetical protein
MAIPNLEAVPCVGAVTAAWKLLKHLAAQLLRPGSAWQNGNIGKAPAPSLFGNV